LLLIAALACPVAAVALVPMPPLFDYHNHIARLWLLSGGTAAAPISEIYAIDWTGASTNIGIDLIAAALGGAVPVGILAPVLLALALALPPLGAVALNRAAFGGWHWWQVGFPFLAWSTTALEGFLNFHIGLGLALLAAAADSAVRRWPAVAAFALRAAVAAVGLLVHPFAALFYAALLCAMAVGPSAAGWRSARGLGRAAAAAFAAALPVLVVVLLVVLLAPALPGADQDAAERTIWTGYTLREKAETLLTAVWTYRLKLDLLLTALFGLPVLWALATRRLSTHAGLLLAAVLLAALAVATPRKLSGAWQMDTRFPIMAALAGVAALRPALGGAHRAAQTALAGALFALVAARSASIVGVWEARRSDVVAVERALAHVPPGAAVLPMEHTFKWENYVPGGIRPPRGRYVGPGNPAFWHLPALAIPQRRAFVPTLFAARGKQPVRVLPPWDEIAQQDAELVSMHLLQDPDPDFLQRHTATYVRWWRERFDYVLVLNADLPDHWGPPPTPPELEMVADEGFARLYRINGGARIASGSGAAAIGRAAPPGPGSNPGPKQMDALPDEKEEGALGSVKDAGRCPCP
jgi:hypothetical protein